MVEKPYQWVEGAVLEEHSRRKHKILKEYFFEYLIVRCQLPQQERFRLAIVDGFAGGGRYQCGTEGSPLIFLQELRNATDAINIDRLTRGLNSIQIEALLVFNDASLDAIGQLRNNVAPLQFEIARTCPNLHVHVEYLNDRFEAAYPTIKALLSKGCYRNVIFNLDQCGHSHVDRQTILDIMQSYPAAELFYTFMIQSLLAFLQKRQPDKLRDQLSYLSPPQAGLDALNDLMSQRDWLGAAERLVFEQFRTCAPFVSPFSINNPGGWHYWLIHFANSYRARQVYNNILHDNATLQAHFGRSGLNMLSYDPRHESGTLYLFDQNARSAAKTQLTEDIPRLVSEIGDAVHIREFYETIYNVTPAHSDDVHAAIIDNPDLEVITPAGGERRKSTTITLNDVIRLRRQRSFFPLFFKDNGVTKS